MARRPALRLETPAGMPRTATSADNAGLLALAASCPMRADISICVHRSPDFFALNRLEGDDWRVSVVDAPGDAIAGCIAIARRRVWLDGRTVDSFYVSDLKVHPVQRGTGIADALQRGVWEWCRAVGRDQPALITVLAGNRAMDRRIRTIRSMPQLTRVGSVRVHTVPLLRRAFPLPGFPRVSRASAEDVAELADLWSRVAAERQFAVYFDAPGLARWIAAAPDLRLEDYLVARDGTGRIVGFLALWNQHRFKQLHVAGLSPRGHLFRGLFNTGARACGARRLPPVGDAVRCLATVHVCVPPDRPDVLRRLLLAAGHAAHGTASFFTIGLDARDPLASALAGLRSLPSDVDLYATSANGGFGGLRHGDRLVHFETSLV
jgi:GNAT superfamily N-acetyltransferase